MTEAYRCSNKDCPVAFRDVEKGTKKCAKCGAKVVKVEVKEGD